MRGAVGSATGHHADTFRFIKPPPTTSLRSTCAGGARGCGARRPDWQRGAGGARGRGCAADV